MTPPRNRMEEFRNPLAVSSSGFQSHYLEQPLNTHSGFQSHFMGQPLTTSSNVVTSHLDVYSPPWLRPIITHSHTEPQQSVNITCPGLAPPVSSEVFEPLPSRRVTFQNLIDQQPVVQRLEAQPSREVFDSLPSTTRMVPFQNYHDWYTIKWESEAQLATNVTWAASPPTYQQ